MELTKVFTNGSSQAVRIPKEYRFSVNKVYINKVGDALILTPMDKLQDVFDQGLADVTADFMEDGRPGKFTDGEPETLSI